MKLKRLPTENHVVRHVKKRQILRDDHGNIFGITPDAVKLRDDETYLSVTWLEHFDQDYEQGLIGAAGGIRSARFVAAKDGFSVAGVDAIQEACASRDVKVRIVHQPNKLNNTGHSALRQLPQEHQDLFELLATEAFTDTRSADTVP